MKKIILSAVAIFSFGIASAQIKTDAGTFNKPAAGTWIMEATMTPNISGGSIFSLPTLNSSLSNLDGGVGILGVKARKFSSDKKAMRMIGNLQVQNSSEENAAGDKAQTEFAVGFGIGIENHMSGAERLSTYWGYQADFTYVSANGANIDKNDTGIGVGASVFTGFDYYIMPKIYLGAEIGYGLGVTSEKSGVDGSDGVTKISLAPGITPSFRLGWQF